MNTREIKICLEQGGLNLQPVDDGTYRLCVKDKVYYIKTHELHPEKDVTPFAHKSYLVDADTFIAMDKPNLLTKAIAFQSALILLKGNGLLPDVSYIFSYGIRKGVYVFFDGSYWVFKSNESLSIFQRQGVDIVGLSASVHEKTILVPIWKGSNHYTAVA